MKRYLRRLIAMACLVVLAGLVVAVFSRSDPGDRRLRKFVHSRPPVPIVFTSRSDAASLQPAADAGECFVYPGQPLWQAREGRLRLLKPNGAVHELTWGKLLPDGTTLIDVMSPSVSPDGQRIVFAGRKTPLDHFRLYEINIDGTELRQLTGGPNDQGCIAEPPMRYRSEDDQTILSDEERKQVDYDDIDPVHLNFSDGRIAFISSRNPDLGRGHARRSTTLWIRYADGSVSPLTANRNNDRWPYLTRSNLILFSLWSRNLEVVSHDRTEIVPFEKGMQTTTQPTDAWLGAFVQNTGAQFGGLIKPAFPVWRPRPLFNGNIVVMTGTTFDPARADVRDLRDLTLAQVEPGFVSNSPSSLGHYAPSEFAKHVRYLPTQHQGSRLVAATPSPCPTGKVVFSAASFSNRSEPFDPRNFGLYMCSEDWPSSSSPFPMPYPPGATGIASTLLFDDPNFVDSEPVAVYRRDITIQDRVTLIAGKPESKLTLANGKTYEGPAGSVFGTAIFTQQHRDAPGQKQQDGHGFAFTAPPDGSIDHIRIYASHRDRFDDPNTPRISGGWELFAKAPVKDGAFGVELPAGIPTVLAGFDREGKVVQWSSRTYTSRHYNWFNAFAGDHYSAVQPGGRHFCTGCHTGHSNLGPDQHDHAEVWRR